MPIGWRGITQDLGFEEYFEDDGVCVIEWPHFIESQLPGERLHIDITRVEGEDENECLHLIQKAKCMKKLWRRYNENIMLGQCAQVSGYRSV